VSTRDDADALDAIAGDPDRSSSDGRPALTLVRPSSESRDGRDAARSPVEALRALAVTLAVALRQMEPPLSASDVVYVDRVACDLYAESLRVPSPALRAAAGRVAARCRQAVAAPTKASQSSHSSQAHDLRALAALLDGIRLAAVVLEEQSQEALRQMLRASLGADCAEEPSRS
jgi:hypothetical protein